MPISRFLAALSLLAFLVPSSLLLGGSFVTFESGEVRPLALSPSKALLFAANTPDSRVEIFQVTPGGLEPAGEVVVGLEPVAIQARTESEVYVVNHLSDSVSVLDATDPAHAFVRTTLLVGDEPRDVVIGGPARDKIFVTTAHRGQNRPGDPQLTTPGVGRADVWVFSAANLSTPPQIITLFCDTPRALAVSPDGSRVYAAAFHSGNRTTTLEQLAVTSDAGVNAAINDGFTAPGMPAPTSNTDGAPAPETGLIVKFDGSKWRDSAGRDWSRRVRFNLADKDLFVIDAAASPPLVIDQVRSVGTILFNIAVNPANGKVYVSNLESQNHLRFEPVISGHIAENRITIYDGTTVTPVHLNPHIDYSRPAGPPSEVAASLAFPLGMEFTQDGSTFFVAAFGSGKVAVLDAAAHVLDRIDVGGGPSGLALDEVRGRLYVLNRFDQTISIVDTGTRQQGRVVSLRYNPEPPAAQAGRPVLYDARSSGHGDAACASCHVFADFDSLAWDLGNPGGKVETNPLDRVSVQGASPLGSFHPMKGPMTTQSLRGMAGAGAMHWRGDRNGGSADPFSEELAFMAFRPAFQGLLGMGVELPATAMEKFRDFILTVQYPPSPIASLDGTLTAQQAAGKEIFDSSGSRSGLGGDGNPCASCHTLPLGTDGHGSTEGLTQDFKVAHLRNLYQKVGMFGTGVPHIASDSPFALEPAPTPQMGDQVRGFGLLHDGSVPNLFSFCRFPLRQFTFPDQPGRSGSQKVRELEAFLLSFPTGLAPVVGQQITVDPLNIDLSPSPAVNRYNLLRARADAGDCDLVVHGIVAGLQRGFFHTGGGVFQSDRRREQLTEGDLASLIRQGGSVLTATAVPRGSGTRLGIDRDEDGWLDLDEAENGSDAASASSIPCPPAPAGVTAEPGADSATSATVSWSLVTSPLFPITGYNLYRAPAPGGPGARLNSSPLTGLSYVDAGLAPGVYYYRVTALGNSKEGPPSGGAEARIPGQGSPFQRGNCNGDATVDISDPIFLLAYLFSNGSPPSCLDACNANGDSENDISDAVFTLIFLFNGGRPPGLYPACERGSEPCPAAASCN